MNFKARQGNFLVNGRCARDISFVLEEEEEAAGEDAQRDNL
jgi:hypothetical protein